MKVKFKSTDFNEVAEVLNQTGNDALGEPIYSRYCISFAHVKDIAGNETLIDSQNKRVSTAKTTFTFRSTPETRNILPTMKIRWSGYDHNILTPVVFSDDRLFVSVDAVRTY